MRNTKLLCTAMLDCCSVRHHQQIMFFAAEASRKHSGFCTDSDAVFLH